MRLTAFLMHVKKKAPHGHKYRGKNRVVLDPKINDLWVLRKDFVRTEENMLILRHPYITVEQEKACEKYLYPKPYYTEETNMRLNEKFRRHFRWVDQLCHLRSTEAWD